MLLDGTLDAAFICSGAYIEIKPGEVEIIAVPLIHGRPFYRSYIIVHRKSGINSFLELKGKKFAFTDPLSNTGFFYPEYRLMRLGIRSEKFFVKTIFTYGHDNSIKAVEKGIVDGAAIDGLIYDYIFSMDSSKVKDIAVIEKSREFGIPPFVAGKGIDPELKIQLKRLILNIHKDSEGNEILRNLMIDSFVEADDSNYDSIRIMRREILSGNF